MTLVSNWPSSAKISLISTVNPTTLYSLGEIEFLRWAVLHTSSLYNVHNYKMLFDSDMWQLVLCTQLHFCLSCLLVMVNLRVLKVQATVPTCLPLPLKVSVRHASSKRWQARRSKDNLRREAIVKGLKSRAAFKILEVITQPARCLLLKTDHGSSRSMIVTGYSNQAKRSWIW